MAKLIVGVGDCIASKDPSDEIKTYALGSCVALILLDPQLRAGAMAHIALPESNINLARSKERPGYFADTAIPYLFNLMSRLGSIPHKKYIIKLIGGANVVKDEDRFVIGERNITAVKKILWNMNYAITAEDVGKNFSRTVALDMKNGKITITSSDGKSWSI
ncbi:MAG: hypothetical protein A2504_15185 [Bdellovibrionales bacterium RIFOXYD12_FULL_39_22]|nr:MAG: hypothetical protein A2385_02615 [Bdellovibrionales bacterium RIFOXYB1_FULL_39_21]OFZ43139.1 MAG: hypothetical protein A2485_11760 [Bdellovibrionales bacterium RIFOXYC12_FULL_39_17]OFZ47877.1 MAG: hypothetical protein A2404_16400 [Bdellovibrionales bacterium RIFOXYC1_FULL_39_130]OFZ69961.1 MAG: hypothetical protein A2451_07850 [Bdellovibrionales bacterium RIFOXYC2_FULL_39_8]OFZ75657.1 MAG: hypothetical protein A2560_12900 [Bdellovibrionales bacterium RIFOXYD1_FULL_39_84]OFZ94147.1 MAG: